MVDEGAKHRLERFYAVAAARIAELDADPNPKLTPLRDVMGHGYGAAQLRRYVDFPRFQPGCRVDYPVHYGIGVHAPAEPSMPVLLLVLGAGYGHARPCPGRPAHVRGRRAQAREDGFASSPGRRTIGWSFLQGR